MEEKYGLFNENELNSELKFSLHPLLLHDQLTRSLENLGVSQLDCYYINLPEILLEYVSKDEFLNQLITAFEFLENQVKEGRIKSYGITCWNWGRKLSYSKFYFDFNQIMKSLEDRVGVDHHFKFVQIPLSIGMSENFSEKYTISPSSGGIIFIYIYLLIYRISFFSFST